MPARAVIPGPTRRTLPWTPARAGVTTQQDTIFGRSYTERHWPARCLRVRQSRYASRSARRKPSLSGAASAVSVVALADFTGVLPAEAFTAARLPAAVRALAMAGLPTAAPTPALAAAASAI